MKYNIKFDLYDIIFHVYYEKQMQEDLFLNKNVYVCGLEFINQITKF